MFRKLDFASGSKNLWFVLVSLLLGPFALWFVLYGKKHRRNLQPAYFSRVSILVFGFLAFQFLLFLAPVHWTVVLGLYLLAASATAWIMHREEQSQFFQIRQAGKLRPTNTHLGEAFLAAALAIYPLVYILALLHNIGELKSFSIHLPSDVYTDGLLWMLYATPVVAMAGLFARKTTLNLGMRALVYFYGAVLVVLIWIMVWERCDQYLLDQIYGFDREPLFFLFRGEARFRSLIKVIFYGGAFLLGIGYLVGAARTSAFLKRAIYLGLPSILLYANMLFVIGDWNFYLAGFRERAYASHHFDLYRLMARSQLLRTPSAFRTPAILEEWAELEYQVGDRDKSMALLRDLSIRCSGKPYYGRMQKRADRSLTLLAREFSVTSSTKDTLGAKTLRLILPVIKPASYLDREWFALLSAVAYLKPDWTDLELKKRLLELSNTVQLHLPKLDNIPDLIPALRELEIPVSTCFLTNDRIKVALAAGYVPFLSLYGHWVPISGYDSGRDGFYYYSYQSPGGWDWFRNEDMDLFLHQDGKTFGVGSGKTEVREKGSTGGQLLSLQKFIPADELAEHVVDIGGVGMVLGDSAMVGAPERKAAFLVEQGDIYYQEYENYEEAAAAYKEASKLFPDDQIYSRMLYLKRRYWEFASDPGDYQNLFRDYPPAWMGRMGPDPVHEKKIVAKVIQGKLGSYLMMNWYAAPLPDSSEKSKLVMDTALGLFTLMHGMEPEEPLYTDSLATFMQRRGNLTASESLFTELSGLYPFGSESAIFRLAWVKFKLGKLEELPDLLEQCETFSGEAKYLTLKAAVAIHKGRFRSAFASLSHSLKIDKSIGETHVLMEAYYRHRGDKASEQVHHQWQRRST